MQRPGVKPAAIKSDNLHGGRPRRSPVALLLVDVINDLEFDGGEELLVHALPMAQRLAAFKKKAQAARIPVIYANDNFGQWQSDFARTVRHCCSRGVRGGAMSRLLKPAADDYFVLKPRHSGFFGTTLDILLHHLGTRLVIVAGLATDICVLFTANDAYMREYSVVVPGDCSAAENPHDHDRALRQMQRILKADISPSTDLKLRPLIAAARTISR